MGQAHPEAHSLSALLFREVGGAEVRNIVENVLLVAFMAAMLVFAFVAWVFFIGISIRIAQEWGLL